MAVTSRFVSPKLVRESQTGISRAHRRAHVHDGPERRAGDREGNHRGAVIVNDRPDVGARLVDGAVDEPLGVGLAAAGVDRRAVQRELHDVVRLDALRGARPREAEAIRMLRVPDADVPERIDDPLAREDPVGGDELIEEGCGGRHVAALSGVAARPRQGSGTDSDGHCHRAVLRS